MCSRTPEISPTNYANVGSGIVTFLSVVAVAPLGMWSIRVEQRT
jgi:hypothetical protein